MNSWRENWRRHNCITCEPKRYPRFCVPMFGGSISNRIRWIRKFWKLKLKIRDSWLLDHDVRFQLHHFNFDGSWWTINLLQLTNFKKHKRTRIKNLGVWFVSAAVGPAGGSKIRIFQKFKIKKLHDTKKEGNHIGYLLIITSEVKS